MRFILTNVDAVQLFKNACIANNFWRRQHF